MKKFIVPLITAAVVVSLTIGGCARAPAVEEWKIPTFATVSGPHAFAGKGCNWGREWAVDQINAAGGIAGKPVVLEYYDDECRAAKAATQVSGVIDWALVILAPMCDTAAIGALPVTSEAGIYCFCYAGLGTAEAYHPWTWSGWSDNTILYAPAAKAWVKQEGIKKICPIIGTHSAPYCETTELAMAGAEEMGVEVTGWVDVPEEIVDFGPVAVKALATGADGFYITAFPANTAKVLVELRKRGLEDNTRIMLGLGQITPDLWELNAGQMEGAYSVDEFNLLCKNPRWLAFNEWMKATNDMPAFVWQSPMVDEIYLIKAAIEDLKITGDPAKLTEERIAIRDYCNNVKDFPGVMGPLDAVDGVRIGTPYLCQCSNDQFLPIGIADPEGNLLPLE